MLPAQPASENERERLDLRNTASQGLVFLSLVDDLVFLNMFFRFAVAFLEYSEKLRLIRGGNKKGS